MMTPYATPIDALVTAASGCVTCARPIGDETPALDVSAWDGVWMGACVGDDAPTLVAIEVTEPRLARIVLTWPTVSESGLVLRRARATVGSLRGDLFANVETTDHQARARYIPLRIRHGEDRLIAWELDSDAVRDLVATGALPGAGTELDGPSARDMAVLHERLASAVDWGDPLWLRRVATKTDTLRGA